MIKKYFKETVKQLLLPAIVLCIISLIVAIDSVFLDYSSPIKIDTLRSGDLYSTLMCFITPVILTVVAFSYLKSRKKQDFFDALPLPRMSFFLLRAAAVFVMSFAAWLLPLIISLVAVVSDGVPVTFLNVLSEILGAIRCTAVATAAGALAAVAFKKPFMTLAGSFGILYIPYWYFSVALTLLNRSLPRFGYYDENPTVKLPTIPDTYTLFNGQQIVLSLLLLMLQLLLCALTVWLAAVIYKKINPDSKMPPVCFYLMLALPTVLLATVWETTVGDSFTYIVFALMVLVYFVPIIFKYKSVKRTLQSIMVYALVVVVTYFVMYTIPKKYSDYNDDTIIYANSVKSVEIVNSYSSFLESGMKTEDKTLILEFISGITTQDYGTTIIKLDIGKPLPVYRYVNLELDSEAVIHDTLVGAEHIIEYIEEVSGRLSSSIFLNYSGHSAVEINKDTCNSIIEMLKQMPKEYWYKMRNNDNIKNMSYGQNSFMITADEYNYSFSPAAFPEFFDVINAQIDERAFVTDFQNETNLDKYQIAGNRFKKSPTPEVKAIITEALSRDMSNMVDEMGADEFAKGGVWIVETLNTDPYYVTPMYCYHLLPLTKSECEILIEFFNS